MLTQTPYVIGSLSFEGITLPDNWFACNELKTFSDTFPEGRPNLLAILVLGEIVRWYKPITVRDNLTLETLEVRNRFEGKVYKLHLNSWSNHFGTGTKQIKECLYFLEEKGILILKEEDEFISVMPKSEVIQKLTFGLNDSFVTRKTENITEVIKRPLDKKVEEIPESKPKIIESLDEVHLEEGIPLVQIDNGIPTIITQS